MAGESDSGEVAAPELQALLDQARADDAVQERIRERWLRRQAGEDASFAGVLRDLAQRAVGVSIRTVSGRVHQGMVVAVGADFCTVRTSAGADVHLALRAAAAVRSQPGFRLPGATELGDRDRPSALRLVELLARSVDDRPRVHLAAGVGDPVSGELESVGVDVATVRLDDGQRCYVALGSVAELSFLPSG